EQGNVALLAFREALGSGMAELVGGAGNEAFKRLLRMQHSGPEAFFLLVRRGARRQIGDAGRHDIRWGDFAGDAASDHWGGGSRHHDGKRGRTEAFSLKGLLDAADIMVGDPVANEGLG